MQLGGLDNLRSLSLLIGYTEKLEKFGDMLSSIDSRQFYKIIFELDGDGARELTKYKAHLDRNDRIHGFTSMDGYFSDSNPKFPAQSADVRFLFYKDRQKAGSYAVKADKIIRAVLPQTSALGRIRVKFTDEGSMDWF